MTEILGWASSFILVLTIVRQVYKQWQEGSSEGVSKWLFIGEITASAGFIIYSWLLHNWIFVFTNIAMLLSSLAGLGIVYRHKHYQYRE